MAIKLPNYKYLIRNAGKIYSDIIRYLLYAVMVVIILALIVGIIKTGIDLFSSLRQPLNEILQKIVVDAVFIIALVEISVIVFGYLKNGSIRLRYIVDTILIIMIGEVISAWFRRPSLAQVGSLAIIIATLIVVRLGVMYIETNSSKEP